MVYVITCPYKKKIINNKFIRGLQDNLNLIRDNGGEIIHIIDSISTNFPEDSTFTILYENDTPIVVDEEDEELSVRYKYRAEVEYRPEFKSDPLPYFWKISKKDEKGEYAAKKFGYAMSDSSAWKRINQYLRGLPNFNFDGTVFGGLRIFDDKETLYFEEVVKNDKI